MDVRRFLDPHELRSAVLSVLVENEALNCLPIGLIDTLISQPDRYPVFHLCALEESGKAVGMAWMTPPHPLGLSTMPASAIEPLLDYAASLPDKVAEVVGPRPAVDRFRALWTEKCNVRVSHEAAMRIFQLDRMIPPRPIPGIMRAAGEEDRALLEDWGFCFLRDCHLSGDRAEAAASAEFALKSGSRYLWETGGRIVSMAGFQGRTPNGIRIGYVYTPDKDRGKGYASALVAALSQKLLEEGRRFCFLYTDLANPTSNSIYQKIGYRPVGDAAHYKFCSRDQAATQY